MKIPLAGKFDKRMNESGLIAPPTTAPDKPKPDRKVIKAALKDAILYLRDGIVTGERNLIFVISLRYPELSGTTVKELVAKAVQKG